MYVALLVYILHTYNIQALYTPKKSHVRIQSEVVLITKPVLAYKREQVIHYTFALPIGEHISDGSSDACCKQVESTVLKDEFKIVNIPAS